MPRKKQLALQKIAEEILKMGTLLIHKKLVTPEDFQRVQEKWQLAKMGGAKELEDLAHHTLHLLDGTDCGHKFKT